MKLAPLPPYEYQHMPAPERSKDTGEPERIPEVQHVRKPEQPHEHEPGTETPFPTPEVVSVPFPTAQVPRSFIESSTPEHPAKPRASETQREHFPERTKTPEQPASPVVTNHPETVQVPPVADVQRRGNPTHEQPKTRPETIRQKPEKQFGNNSPNNSETIRNPNSLAPTEQAPQGGKAPYKKKGVVGRKRKYEDVGNNGEIPVKEVVLFRYIQGRHWPGMSQDMREWYDKYYFNKPKRAEKAEEHARHIKSWERGQRWIAEYEASQGRSSQSQAVGNRGTVLPYRKRASS